MAASGGTHWRSLRHGFLFQLDIGMDIHLCSFDGFMAEPERDHRAVHSVLKKLHGCAVAKYMWCYALGLHRWAFAEGDVRILPDNTFNSITAEPISAITDEQRLGVGAGSLGKPRTEGLYAVFPQWG